MKDYEKKYKEALERAKKYKLKEDLIITQDIFPELAEPEDEKTKKEIINYLECQSRDEPSRKDTHNKWIGYIEKYALSKDDYGFLRDCARVLKTFGWQSYSDRLTGLCPALGEEAKAMMSTPIIFNESEDERIRKAIINVFAAHKDYEIFFGVSVEDILAWLEKQGEKDKLIKELGEYKVKYTKEVLEKHINNMSNKDDERLRNTTIAFLKDFAEQGYENAVECIDWLEKQEF